MDKLKPSERTKRRIQMFIDRKIYKNKLEVINAAIELLIRHQMEIDTEKQTETYKPDEKIASDLMAEAAFKSEDETEDFV